MLISPKLGIFTQFFYIKLVRVKILSKIGYFWPNLGLDVCSIIFTICFLQAFKLLQIHQIGVVQFLEKTLWLKLFIITPIWAQAWYFWYLGPSVIIFFLVTVGTYQISLGQFFVKPTLDGHQFLFFLMLILGPIYSISCSWHLSKAIFLVFSRLQE